MSESDGISVAGAGAGGPLRLDDGVGASLRAVATLRSPEGVVSQAPAESRVSGRSAHHLARIRHYLAMFRRSAHVRLALANTVSGLLPDVASGVVRGRLYRWAGFHVSKDSFIMGNLSLTSAYPQFYDKLVIGPGTTIADHVTMNLDAAVIVGKNVAIAPHVVICTGSHRIGPGSMRLGAGTGLPVTIEDGAWVRLGATIAPGVTIGRGSIVATGAVVLKDVPANSYVEGNPAAVIRRLPWGDR